MATSYIYSIANDFPNGLVNTDKLQNEILKSSITTGLDYIKTSDDTITIVFKMALSTSDKTILDGDTTNPAGGLIANHDNSKSTTTEQMVTVMEEKIPTNGKWKAEALWIHGATGPDVVTTTDLSYKYPITALNIHLRTTDENMGDSVEMCIAPDIGLGDGILGTLQQTAATGATGIYVSQTVTDNAFPSDIITLVDNQNEDQLGEITSVDKQNKILYLTNPTSYYFDTDTNIKLTRYVMSPFVLGPPDLYVLGNSKIGGSHLPAGHRVKVNYKNMGSVPKKLYIINERLQ